MNPYDLYHMIRATRVDEPSKDFWTGPDSRNLPRNSWWNKGNDQHMSKTLLNIVTSKMSHCHNQQDIPSSLFHNRIRI